MRSYHVAPGTGFHVLGNSGRSEAATMVLGAGEETGGPDNRHADSDQWLFVIEGDGQAVVAEQTIPLSRGMLLLIEAGEAHRVQAAPDHALKTVNIYAPPAY